MSGLFVTFEGGEGSGKSTQLERLAARLAARGVAPLVTREPGGTPLAEGIRELLLGRSESAARELLKSMRDQVATSPGSDAMSPVAMSELFLLEAARAECVERVIRPALAAGRIVLCDRYDDSTLAYQGGGRGIDTELLRALNRAATGGLTPDLTLLFDLEPAIGLARRAGDARALDRLDREPESFHVRVRARYLELAAREPDRFVVLNGAEPPERLAERVWRTLEPRLVGLGV
jgi:dTMP kinase